MNHGAFSNPYQAGYNLWRIEAECTEAVRMGYALAGVYDYREENVMGKMCPATIYQDRSESDIEHSSRVECLLFWAISEELLPTNIIWNPDLLRLLPLAGKIHDQAERYCGGDIVDDGTRSKDQDVVELKVFEDDILPNYHPEIASKLHFLLKDLVFKRSPYGQLLYCADKIDAVLRGLYYEELGRVGFETNKQNISESSLESIKFTEREEIVDNWFLGFLKSSENFTEIRRPFIELVRIACIRASEVRPEREPWFTWWDKYQRSVATGDVKVS